MQQPSLTHRTLTEGAEQILRRMIVNGQLPPSERINEVQLAEQLEMSRGPIREALRRLQTEGLVIYHPHRGTFVKTLSKKEAQEIYSLRGLLEVEAARLALHQITQAQIRILQSFIGKFEAAKLKKDTFQIIQYDLEFHHIIVAASGHGRLFDLYKALDTQVGSMFLTIQSKAPSRYSMVAEIHQVLIDALISGDEDTVTNEFRQHYDAAWRILSLVLPEE